MTTPQYLENISRRYALGNATEHTYRADLQHLLETLLPEMNVTNEPQRRQCGAPDYIIARGEIPIGFVEAKDIGDADLFGKKTSGNKEQFDRYKAALPNLIFTDYLRFVFYANGEMVSEITIGRVGAAGIVALPEEFARLEHLIKNFSLTISQTIRNPKELAEMMAGKARLLSDVIARSVNSDEHTHADSTLREQMAAIKQILIHDITPESFADVYAQTIAYGMFAARLHDPTLPTFSRQEAAELIPKSNPFLRKLFGYIAGPDIDSRIQWIVDNLVEIFRHCDVAAILRNYGRGTQTQDPIIHFYETFLSAYDPKLRKSRGVWYTPQPVVDFIVRAVDDILKSEFGLPMGLADTSKTNIKVPTVTKATADQRSNTKTQLIDQEVHRVQILDPATGTGTFLAQVVQHIYETRFKGQQGIWSQYVSRDLLPRLNGFELLMASYAMAHLKLDLLLTETGYQRPQDTERLRIYLTNSLEESHPDTGSLFANWLSAEANEANRIKRDTPVMVVMGNPPYSGESANKGPWIQELMEDYKMEPGGKVKLKERNPKWINDDYVKFLRYGQHFIEKNGSGVLAFINPHGYLDNPTFRGMRWNLLKTYDTIYTIDLHGNSKKKETAPDGSKDDNVFDIMQGVSINVFVKTGKKKEGDLAQVFHFDLFGKRQAKYDFLNGNSLKSVKWNKLPNVAPMYFMVGKDFELQGEYQEGFSVNELFSKNSCGIATARDAFTIKFSLEEIIETVKDFAAMEIEAARIKYDLRQDVRDWKVSLAQLDVRNNLIEESNFTRIQYRPFDTRYTFYTGNSKGFQCMPRQEIMNNLHNRNNLSYNFPRQCKGDKGFHHGFVTKDISDVASGDAHSGSGTNIFPLYLYPETSPQQTLEAQQERKVNFDLKIAQQIAAGMNCVFVEDDNIMVDLGEGYAGTVHPLNILDYIYAVLHSPAYREQYKEFLKIDFPRVPYPKDHRKFEKLCELGGRLRELHLMTSPVLDTLITGYPVGGSNVVEKPSFAPTRKDGKGNVLGSVYINETQYFSNVPEAAWQFYIGGYQPAQKWLKDRKGRELSYEDIGHWQRVVVALAETGVIMCKCILEF